MTLILRSRRDLENENDEMRKLLLIAKQLADVHSNDGDLLGDLARDLLEGITNLGLEFDE